MSRILEQNSRTHPQIPDSATCWPAKSNLIGVQVSEVDYDLAVERISQAARAGESGVVSCHAVHAIVTMSCNENLKTMVNQFQMITPDGQPVRWAMNLLNRSKLKDRVYGPELMLRLCRRAEQDQLPIYLYGGNDQVSDNLVKALSTQFPGLIIAGAEAPPFRTLTDEEDAQVVRRITESGARLVFIGLGCPKQDIFAHEHRDRLQVIQICVGAAFDFHAGAKPMAPKWMQNNGLDTFHRIWRSIRTSLPKRTWCSSDGYTVCPAKL